MHRPRGGPRSCSKGEPQRVLKYAPLAARLNRLLHWLTAHVCRVPSMPCSLPTGSVPVEHLLWLAVVICVKSLVHFALVAPREIADGALRASIGSSVSVCFKGCWSSHELRLLPYTSRSLQSAALDIDVFDISRQRARAAAAAAAAAKAAPAKEQAASIEQQAPAVSEADAAPVKARKQPAAKRSSSKASAAAGSAASGRARSKSASRTE